MAEQLVNTSGIAVWCGLAVGKEEPYACVLVTDGMWVPDRPLPQDETNLREIFTTLQQHGPVLVVVDQQNTIGALGAAVARDAGCQVAHLPGLAMRKHLLATVAAPRTAHGRGRPTGDINLSRVRNHARGPRDGGAAVLVVPGVQGGTG